MTEYDPVRRRRDWERKKEQDRRDALAVRIRFVCARCGGKYHVPDSIETADDDGPRGFVRLGGKTVCEVCARRPKRRVITGILPDAIAPGMRFAK